MKTIIKTLIREGVITKESTSLKGMRFFKGAGCAMCGNEGYHGRLATHEVLELTPELSALIHNQVNANELKTTAHAQGMITLVEDAFIKAKQGLTTITEILRVTKE